MVAMLDLKMADSPNKFFITSIVFLALKNMGLDTKISPLGGLVGELQAKRKGGGHFEKQLISKIAQENLLAFL
jgi:hypothetical protein